MAAVQGRIIKQIALQSHHVVTGNTRHFREGVLAAKPARLIIVRFSEGYNLIHLDAEGQELTDTFHETADEAVAQAMFEFSAQPSEWTDADVPY